MGGPALLVLVFAPSSPTLLPRGGEGGKCAADLDSSLALASAFFVLVLVLVLVLELVLGLGLGLRFRSPSRRF
jgi:hypothetical protein